jgi:hypothetical protein
VAFDEDWRHKYQGLRAPSRRGLNLPGPSKVYGSAEAALAEQRRVERIIIHEVIPQAHYESATRLVRKLSRSGPVDTRQYRHGWEVRRTMRSAVKGGGFDTYAINTTPYSGVIEQGARPFWPPLEPLVEWARRKAGALALAGLFSISASSFTERNDGSLRYRGGSSLNMDDNATVLRFAKAVRYKISRVGLPAHWTNRNALPFAVRALDRAVKKRFIALAQKGLL